LITTSHRTVARVAGPLLVAGAAWRVALGEIASITLPDGRSRLGQVLEVRDDLAVIQVFGETEGIDTEHTTVHFSGETPRFGVSREMLGRTLDGRGNPVDGGHAVLPEAQGEVNGLPLNPYAREQPADPIETGVSAIDGLNTLVRGQKLPIFSAFGLPGNELAVQIATQAHLGETAEPFAVVFAAMGITQREVAFFRSAFQDAGVLDRTVLFVNLASDSALERLLTPRYALTVAEHLAYTCGLHVLVILTDITNYCEALRELGAAREEVPGRRGYPGYMYTDLASVYERAGRVRTRPGSITQLLVLSMPDDDITHPIPDLTGYITEGQIVLSRDLHRRGVSPPVDVLPSLSRLMNQGIGEGKTRDDHRGLADQLYASYARGRELRRLEAILGEAALSTLDRRYLTFASAFETDYVGQRAGHRTLEETLDLGWKLLGRLPRSELTRVQETDLARRYREEQNADSALPRAG
jgi:V/A-type H+-transporting ATPase subunit B